MKVKTTMRLEENVKIMLTQLAESERRSSTKMNEYLIAEAYKLTFGIDAYLALITK